MNHRSTGTAEVKRLEKQPQILRLGRCGVLSQNDMRFVGVPESPPGLKAETV
jgi:hypothetical protein